VRISLVVPVFNEQETVDIFYHAVRTYSAFSNDQVEIVYINDGSTDQTLEKIKQLAHNDHLVTIVSFSRNFGKEAALMAGLDHCSGDAIIPIDVDLQDPIEIIPLMLEKYQQGFDVVLAKRKNRESDTIAKRLSASIFYKFHNKISNPKIVENVGDFRLMSRKVVDAIKCLPETNLFMKGILSWVGFRTTLIEYVRPSRSAGTTKFNALKLLSLAQEGITSFSTFPLKFWTIAGFLTAVLSLLYASLLIFQKIYCGDTVSDYASIMVCILFLGGVQLIGIGTLGEYIGRIYLETKRRPRYIVEQTINLRQPSMEQSQAQVHHTKDWS